MKKVILFAAILFAGVSVVKAEGPVNTGKVNLTVHLSPVQHIEVSGDANIYYESAGDYASGKKSNESTLLEVTSSGGYSVSVTADDLTLAGATSIGAETISLLVKKGEEDVVTEADNKNIKSAEKFITSTTGGSKVAYNVQYKGTGLDKYYKNYNSLTNAESSIQKYSTKVVYTITTN